MWNSSVKGRRGYIRRGVPAMYEAKGTEKEDTTTAEM
jgi:hypothetical protein